VVGQLFQQVSHQVRVVDGHWWDTHDRLTSWGNTGYMASAVLCLPGATEPSAFPPTSSCTALAELLTKSVWKWG
jgi:hypothetical protein